MKKNLMTFITMCASVVTAACAVYALNNGSRKDKKECELFNGEKEAAGLSCSDCCYGETSDDELFDNNEDENKLFNGKGNGRAFTPNDTFDNGKAKQFWGTDKSGKRFGE